MALFFYLFSCQSLGEGAGHIFRLETQLFADLLERLLEAGVFDGGPVAFEEAADVAGRSRTFPLANSGVASDFRTGDLVVVHVENGRIVQIGSQRRSVSGPETAAGVRPPPRAGRGAACGRRRG